MLAQIFKAGQAASTAPSMRSPPVVRAPALPCSLSINCALDQFSSAWLASTSKCCCRRAMVSGKMARATRILGLFIKLECLSVDRLDLEHLAQVGQVFLVIAHV